MEKFSTESLNIGDEVIIVTSIYSKSTRRIGKILKKTPTGRVDVETANGSVTRFTSDGHEYAKRDIWSRHAFLEYATPEKIAEIKAATIRKRMIVRLNETKWGMFHDEVLEQILQIVNAKIKTENTGEPENNQERESNNG